MRERKPYTIITFDTTTDAIAAEDAYAENGIPGRLIPLPREISASCGLSWRMTQDEYQEYKTAIEALELRHGQIVDLML